MQNSFPADKPVAGQMSWPPQMHDSPPLTPPPRNLLHWAILDGSPSAEDIQADGKGGPAGGQDGSPVAKVARRSNGVDALVSYLQKKHEDVKAGATEGAVGNPAVPVAKPTKKAEPKIDSPKAFDKT